MAFQRSEGKGHNRFGAGHLTHITSGTSFSCIEKVSLEIASSQDIFVKHKFVRKEHPKHLPFLGDYNPPPLFSKFSRMASTSILPCSLNDRYRLARGESLPESIFSKESRWHAMIPKVGTLFISTLPIPSEMIQDGSTSSRC